MTLQEQIDIVLELDAKRTPNTRAKVLCIDKEKDRIYYAMHPEETKEVDINFYTSAPQMVEIIRKQAEIIKVAKEELIDLIEEYLHWRKVNPQIKGGENYLKRFRQALKTIEEMEK